MIKVISGNQSFEIENKTMDEVIQVVQDQMEAEKFENIVVVLTSSEEKVVVIKENNEITIDKLSKVWYDVSITDKEW